VARPMTPAEKQRFHRYFPNLDVNGAIVTGEMSTVYNCIAWTVGIANRWVWPGSSLAYFAPSIVGSASSGLATALSQPGACRRPR
jgi:hypothetical protein